MKVEVVILTMLVPYESRGSHIDETTFSSPLMEDFEISVIFLLILYCGRSTSHLLLPSETKKHNERLNQDSIITTCSSHLLFLSYFHSKHFLPLR